MLSRFISKPSHLRIFTILISSQSHPKLPKSHFAPHPSIPNPNSSFAILPRFFSSNDNNNKKNGGPDLWKLSSETEDSVFGDDGGSLDGISENGVSAEKGNEASWLSESGNEPWSLAADEKEEEKVFDFKQSEMSGLGDAGFIGSKSGKSEERKNELWKDENVDEDDIFKGKTGDLGNVGGNDDWETAEGFEPWSLAADEKEEEQVFGFKESEMGGLGEGGFVDLKSEKSDEEKRLLEKEEKELSSVLKGQNRAFGDLVAASGITEEMLDSLIALKDLEGIQGLPPLSEIEDMRYEKNTRKSSRADIERQKQEEVAKARVRQVDAKGRAYGTGKRKCSIARVWIQPGEGNFMVNDKQFDVYFPMLDHRAALLRPFSETKTLGLWDVNCTVKGGGVSGQVGAIRLGISRALQSWEPDLRPPLKEAGFLTRDSRVVERKKPGKAKARKSFQWVKR